MPRWHHARPLRLAGVLALTVCTALSACSSGPARHRAAPARSLRPTPAPYGPCTIGATVTCPAGLGPIWSLTMVKDHLLTSADVLPSMTHPADPMWWHEGDHNQYMRKWISGPFVPACNYKWNPMSGTSRVIGGWDHLWSDDAKDYPVWPRELVMEYAYAYSSPAEEATDIDTVWNKDQCPTGHLPYRQLLDGWFAPAEYARDEVTTTTVGGWAVRRVVSYRWPDAPASPELDVFNLIQRGNVLIVDLFVEQYTSDKTSQHWARSLADSVTLFNRQMAKLTA